MLSKVLRQVATAQRFTTYGELKEAFRAQLRQLRIRYQQHEFDDVFAIVGSNVRLVTLEPPAPRAFHVEPERRGFSKAEARALFVDWQGQGLDLRPLSRSMPAAAKSPIDVYAPPPRQDWGEHDRY